MRLPTWDNDFGRVWSTGSYPETGLEEIADLLEEDFWTRR